MLEYFTYKKFKKNKEAKKTREEEAVQKIEAGQENDTASSTTTPRQQTEAAAEGSSTPPAPVHLAGKPVLDRSDESFLQNLLSEDGPAPPLPPRVTMPDLDWPSDDASSIRRSASIKEGTRGAAAATAATATDDGGESKESKEATAKKSNRLSQVFSRVGRKKPKHGDTLKPDDAKEPTAEEVDKETKDLTRVLDRLNLSAATSSTGTGTGAGSTVHNKVIALTDDSAEVLRSFTQIFKDLANGVPSAYDDLVQLIKDRDGAITKGFEKLPKGLQKLVTQLPDKITANIAPEVLAAAAKSQGVEAAEHMLAPQNIFKLMTEPGALVAMLRAIVTTLQQRWPAFIGVNVLWSVALALLMFVLWYCYKRGREERMEKEKLDGEAAVAEGSEATEDQLSPAAVSSENRLEAPPTAATPPADTSAQDRAR